MTPIDTVKNIAKILDDKKAENITAFGIRELSIIADYFVIATATSNTHAKALVDDVEEKMSILGVEPVRIEGKASGWTVLDYSSVLVHIFRREMREYYNLERLWADAKSVDLSEAGVVQSAAAQSMDGGGE